ncbi:outer membrane beta-barrel protein [Vibrio neonatus]|uniref:outer membrane beta-barrel protein n=1 Tax=Vibrio neonatus TaxID=278860 RepID=UPI0021C42BCA|nr:outer membrane beta-barrel protein [Vibrio neonatus]
MKNFKWAILGVALVAGYASASEANTTSSEAGFFSGITIGGGYASDSNVQGHTLNGYSAYSRGFLVPSLKDYLFTDFRWSHTTSDNEAPTVSGQNFSAVTFTKYDLERYQANIGVDYPFHATQSITIKPYLTAGWAWDTLEIASQKDHDNGMVGALGLETQFGQHVVTNLGYSEQFSGDLKANQFMLDVGYKFK